jgi:hypothetical protein
MMGKKLISDKAKRSYKNAMCDIIDGLGKVVSIYTLSNKSECPNCYYDSVNNRSLGKCKWTPAEALQKQTEWESQGNTSLMYRYFINTVCPICDGAGFLKVIKRKNIKGIVNWAGSGDRFNSMFQTPAGKESSTGVLIKTDVKYYDIIKKCTKIRVDGIDCFLSEPPYKKGLGNESVLMVVAYTSEKLDIGESDIGKGYYD